jgi:hypothetical protein
LVERKRLSVSPSLFRHRGQFGFGQSHFGSIPNQ